MDKLWCCVPKNGSLHAAVQDLHQVHPKVESLHDKGTVSCFTMPEQVPLTTWMCLWSPWNRQFAARTVLCYRSPSSLSLHDHRVLHTLVGLHSSLSEIQVHSLWVMVRPDNASIQPFLSAADSPSNTPKHNRHAT